MLAPYGGQLRRRSIDRNGGNFGANRNGSQDTHWVHWTSSAPIARLLPHLSVTNSFCKAGLFFRGGATKVSMEVPVSMFIRAVCDQLNNGSKKVLENIGFQNEGTLRKWIVLPAFGDQARDCHVYARICEP